MRPEFRAFKRYLLRQASGFVSEIRPIAKEVILPEGKYIRPTLVFSSAQRGADESVLVRRAAIVELTHLSTLVHDDVIDNASLRRNKITPNSKYGSRTAILLGDVIFSRMMLLAFEDADRRVSELLARCVGVICEGEIRQTLSDRREIVSRRRYYDIVYGKTAALFELSCRLGAMAGDAPQAWSAAAAEVGRQLGIAYQIYDDICDWFMSESAAGKTLGTDLISGKQTFPLIALIEKLSATEAARFVRSLPESDFADIRAKMTERGVLEECSKEFLRRISLAEKAMAPFPENGVKLMDCCAALRDMRIVV